MGVIVRVVQGRVPPEHVPAFRSRAERLLDGARQRDGIVYAQIGRQAHADGGEEILFVSIWRDLDALYGWLGGNDLLRTPLLSDAGADVFEQFEVQHYEALESPGPAQTAALEQPVAVDRAAFSAQPAAVAQPAVGAQPVAVEQSPVTAQPAGVADQTGAVGLPDIRRAPEQVGIPAAR
jgi:quinol monooxygenase YgiN